MNNCAPLTPQELKRKLNEMADVLSGYGVSGTDYLSAITYLIFLKMDYELDRFGLASRLPPNCRWNSLVNPDELLSCDEQRQHYHEILQRLASPLNQDALTRSIFAQAQNKIDHPIYLNKIITLIDEVQWLDFDNDVKGAIYEHLLEKTGQDAKSGAGQYFTPKVLVNLMVELSDPHSDEVIWDPACGTGGLLLGAYKWAQRQTLSELKLQWLKEEGLHGQDNTPMVVTLGAMNMYLHGIEGKNSPITLGDSLLELPESAADVVLANPPFGERAQGSIAIERADFITKTNNNQLNFLQHIMSLLKDGGRAAVVVPENILFCQAGTAIRRALLTQFNLHTILHLPAGIFFVDQINTYILFFTKGEPTQEIWHYDLHTNQNFTTVHNPLKRQHLEDFIKCYNPTGKGTFGPRSETYHPELNPNGRWRKFPVNQFINDQYCSLCVETWIEPPTNPLAQLDLSQLLDLIEARTNTILDAHHQIKLILAQAGQPQPTAQKPDPAPDARTIATSATAPARPQA